MKMKLLLVTAGIVLHNFSCLLNAQSLKQTIRGRVVDADTKSPLIGVTLYIESSEPLIGAVTNKNGDFAFNNVSVGRYTVVANYIGYEAKVAPNLLLGAGKELNLSIELTEQITTLDEVVVKANKNKGQPLNEMASVSARSFTVEETQRYAGSFNDPSRMASSYAGVMGDPDGNNSIIIRGNSPRGLQWIIEGVPVPNPNHYANEGATGGPISILNSSTLGNSDFFTSAFPAEFGNAYSGVFDINLRKGNTYKREYSIQAGVMGFDATVEGPFSDNNGGSYLVNARYSSLALLNEAGIEVAGDAVPKFSDFTVNTHLPTQKFGTFQLFSIGGNSSIEFNEDDFKGWGGSSMLVAGLNHIYPIGESTYIRSSLSYTLTRSTWDEYDTDERASDLLTWKELFDYKTFRVSTKVTHKFSAKHIVKTGVSADIIEYNLLLDEYYYNQERLEHTLGDKGRSEKGNAYFTYKYRPVSSLTLNTGIHVNYLNLNKNYAIEPRFGARWRLSQKQTLSAGCGLHSKSDNISLYLAKTDSLGNPGNKNLDFSKAIHYVVGYENRLTPNLNLKVEAYYQNLYNVPVSSDSANSFSILNETAGYITEPLVNKGYGTNYGFELTLEKFFSNQYYFMLTGSLFESKYTDLRGSEYNTLFNNNYIANVLIGKEWKTGKTKENTFACNVRATYAGGQWFTPIDLEASRVKQETVRMKNKTYTQKRPDYIRADLKLSFRRNVKKTTRVWGIDIQNVTNSLNVAGDFYSSDDDRIKEYTQLGILPTLNYRIEF